jgi:hypothetical protein
MFNLVQFIGGQTTATLNPKPETRNPKPETRNAQLATRNVQPAIHNPPTPQPISGCAFA